MPSSSRNRSIFSFEQRLGNVAEPADQLQIFRAGEIGIEVRLFGHISEEPLVFLQIGQRIAAIELDAAARGLEQPHQNLDGRALARSVRPEQPEHLARPHFERHVLDRCQRAIALRQVADGKHWYFDTGSGFQFRFQVPVPVPRS